MSKSTAQQSYRGTPAERFWRTLKGLLDKILVAYQDKRVLAKLDDLIYNYNHTPHRSLKYATPMEVYENQDSKEVQSRNVKEYQAGQQVRVRLTTKQFQKKSDPQWGQVQTISSKRGYKYKVGNRFIGPQDMQLVTGDVHKLKVSAVGRDMGNLPEGVKAVRKKVAPRPPSPLAVKRMSRRLQGKKAPRIEISNRGTAIVPKLK